LVECYQAGVLRAVGLIAYRIRRTVGGYCTVTEDRHLDGVKEMSIFFLIKGYYAQHIDLSGHVVYSMLTTETSSIPASCAKMTSPDSSHARS